MQKTFDITNETLRLFNALPVTADVVPATSVNRDLFDVTIRNGYIFSPVVLGNYSNQELKNLIPAINELLGVSDAQMNATLHKSWLKVESASSFQLIIEQILHYLTTYGFEAMGLYNEDIVYFPNEVLELPANINVNRIKLTVIKGYTPEELKEKLMGLLGSGIALKSETVQDIVAIAKKTVGFSNNDLQLVKNKEAMIALCDHLGLAPADPAKFLRLLLYKGTGRTLMIKDRDTVAAIEGMENNEQVKTLFNSYKRSYGLQKLATIFFRYKRIFLAFRKGCSELKRDINTIRRLADKHHKPAKLDYLDTLTGAIKHGHKPDTNELLSSLEKVPMARKIRIAQALNYRIHGGSSILYRIRNGKGFATDMEEVGSKEQLERAFDITMATITRGISEIVEGKTILLPDYIDYALPATEKQFSGNFPTGTCITVPSTEYIVFGIHWENVEAAIIDLDLSCTDISGEKFGWDGGWRTNSRSLLFSGDVTDAPKKRGGASELFAITSDKEERIYQLNINYYNYRPSVPVPFGVVVGQRRGVKSLERNNMLTSEELLSRSKTLIDIKQKCLGFVWIGPEGCKFYYTEVALGGGVTSRFPGAQEKALRYMVDYHANALSLREVLARAGANIISPDEIEEGVEIDIDLSPENLERDTILKLIM
jgi:hypothetical protein